jgi:NAD(P)H-hydrate epimerase
MAVVFGPQNIEESFGARTLARVPMAGGGSGDVLTGIVGARLAQGDEPTFATCLSVQLHGAAGDLALARLGGPAVPAGELVASFGAAFRAAGA